jgi:hypothetical protein
MNPPLDECGTTEPGIPFWELHPERTTVQGQSHQEGPRTPFADDVKHDLVRGQHLQRTMPVGATGNRRAVHFHNDIASLESGRRRRTAGFH